MSTNENQNVQILADNQNELVAKRSRIDANSASVNATTENQNTNDTNQKDIGLKSIVTVPIITSDDDHRHESYGKRRTAKDTDTTPSISEKTTKKSSPSRSQSKSKDNHERQRRTSATTPQTSSKSNSHVVSKSKSDKKSSSTSNDNYRRRQQIRTRDEHQNQRRRSSDLLNRHQRIQYPKQEYDRHDLFNEPSIRDSLPTTYHRRNMNGLMLPDNLYDLQQRQPVGHKRFNYNHQSVADHPRFANSNAATLTPLMDLCCPKNSTRRRSSSPVGNEDRK